MHISYLTQTVEKMKQRFDQICIKFTHKTHFERQSIFIMIFGYAGIQKKIHKSN